MCARKEPSIGVRSFFLNCSIWAANKDQTGISGLSDAVPVDPACWEARSYCRAKAWLVPYELAVGELSARPAHRGLSPLVGGCRMSAWLGMDVKPPVHVPEGDKRFADPTWSENPAFFAVRQGYVAASQLVSDLLAAGRATWPGPGQANAKSRLPSAAGGTRPSRMPRAGPPDRQHRRYTMGEMKGQVAIVTGGTRGIGLAISERLLNRGVTVAAGYATNHDHAREFADKYADRGVSIHQGNVGHNQDVLRVFGEVLDRHGHVDILVNNAGITVDKTVRKMDPQEWDHVIHVNLSGAFHVARAVLQHMLDRGYGRIIKVYAVNGGLYM